ncbi:MAG: hypothetical protein PXY39_11440 [archaeon]|nr:hypothetical protein [archaeon]
MPRILATEKWRKERIANLSKWLSAEIGKPSFIDKYLPRTQGRFALSVSEFELVSDIRELLNKEIRKRYAFSNATVYDYAKTVVIQNEELIKKVHTALNKRLQNHRQPNSEVKSS